MLTSSETDERLIESIIPFGLRRFLFLTNYWISMDLVAANSYLRVREDWFDAVFCKSGGISHNVRRGHFLGGDESRTSEFSGRRSFLDVAAGMVELKERECVVKGKAKIPNEGSLILAKNLLGTLLLACADGCYAREQVGRRDFLWKGAGDQGIQFMIDFCVDRREKKRGGWNKQ